MGKTSVYLITRDEYNTFCQELTPDSCENDCIDNFDYWNFEGSRYVNYLTHLSCKCGCEYCSCLTKSERDLTIKEAVFWYIKIGQKYINQENSATAPKEYVYYYLLENGLVIN